MLVVSFAIVAYNEEKTLPRLLEDLCAQDYPHEHIEVLLIDSRSTDGTREIMERFQKEHTDFQRVLVLENAGKTQPCGRNVMLKNYTGDAVVEVDAHASIPGDFISKNVGVLESGEMVCGGRRPNIIEGETHWKKTLLLAETSLFGSGVAPYRQSTKEQYVTSIFHGMYRREVYETVGLYDVRLPRAEDNDMSERIRRAGYRIRYVPDIVSYQYARSSLGQMLRQKYLNGYWIGKTMGINPKCFSIYHFVPFAFVLGILVTTVLAFLGWPVFAAVMWGLYGLAALGFSAAEWIKPPFWVQKLLLPALFLLLHLGYGAGTLVGLIEMPFWCWKIKREQKDTAA